MSEIDQYINVILQMLSKKKFYYKCRLRGLSILPGFLFDSTGQTSCNIRISIVSANLDEIDVGLDIIADILKHCNGIPQSV